ncbi:MAG: YIP1 family protein [Pseudomonadota bacterium]
MKFLTDLAMDTLREPQATAQRIMDWQIDRTTLYMALIAVCAVTAFIVGGMAALGPEPDPALVEAVPAISLLSRPLALFVLTAGGLIVMVHALYWAGKAMGGEGDLSDLLVLLVWLQTLRVAAQLAVLVVGLAVPVIGNLLALVVMVAAFWLMLHFISAALRFGSLLRAFGLLITVSAGLLLGLMLLITLLGLTAGGI